MRSDKLIGPTDLRDYFKSKGWTVLQQALSDRLYVLENEKYAHRQLVFPMDSAAPDYSESVNSVVFKAAELMGVSTQSLISSVFSVKDDVLRIRVSFDGNDAVLPLSFASVIVSNTEKLLKAAACTAIRPLAHHPRLSLTEANQFVEKARFGQTEVGSFILSVACPVNSMEVQGVLPFNADSAPFVRQVTFTVQSAIAQLATAIEEDTIDSLVDNLKKSQAPIISSNLCEAISSMHDDVIENSLDVGFNWSPLHRLPDNCPKKNIRIQHDYFSRIEEIRRELRAVESRQLETFIGTVERLEGEMGDDGRRSGVVVLSLLLADSGDSIRARTVLNADDYAKADHAHMTNGAYIRVHASLRPGRQPQQLTDMRSFEVIV